MLRYLYEKPPHNKREMWLICTQVSDFASFHHHPSYITPTLSYTAGIIITLPYITPALSYTAGIITTLPYITLSMAIFSRKG